MKTNLLSVFAVCAVLLVSCNKQTVEPIDNAAPAAKLNYGMSVKDGRLSFASLSDFKNVIDLQNEDRRKFFNYVSAVPGFISIAKTSENMTKGDVCNCPVEDPYAKAMLNTDFMMDVGSWTVKVNACSEKFYALYRTGLTAEQLAEKLDALVACDFDPDHGFYEIDMDFELAEELSILEEIFAGNPNAAERRCRDVAADDRMAESWADSYGSVTLPETRLHYKKGVFTGFVTIYAFDDGNDNFFQQHWTYSLYESSFKEKCGRQRSIATQGRILYDSHHNWDNDHPGTWWQDRIYEGPRIKAGEGSVRAVSVHRDNQEPPHDFNWETNMLVILF